MQPPSENFNEELREWVKKNNREFKVTEMAFLMSLAREVIYSRSNIEEILDEMEKETTEETIQKTFRLAEIDHLPDDVASAIMLSVAFAEIDKGRKLNLSSLLN